MLRVSRSLSAAGRLSFQLSEKTSNVAHSPMLYDFTITSSENIAGRKTQAFSRRRHAEVNVLMGSRIDKACCSHLAASERGFYRDRKAGHSFQARGEESDSGFFFCFLWCWCWWAPRAS